MTFDQSGLLFEWTENNLSSTHHIARGGSYLTTDVSQLSISYRVGFSLPEQYIGFRVAASHSVTHSSRIELSSVLDINNSNHISGFGAVSYLFKIGQFLVTNTQYVEFLNHIAKIDTYGLYNPSMNIEDNGGIIRYGLSGSYIYVCKPDKDNKPVNYISWHNCARYCNWLHNGCPTGLQSSQTTETGSYSLNGANSGIFTRSLDAMYYLPNENEWVKAAYYNGIGYYNYATQSNTAPTAVGSSDDGDGLF
jgi:hypothetical protein